jgi:hypothetical protein
MDFSRPSGSIQQASQRLPLPQRVTDASGFAVRAFVGTGPQVFGVAHEQLFLFFEPGEHVFGLVTQMTANPAAFRPDTFVSPLVKRRDGDAKEGRNVLGSPYTVLRWIEYGYGHETFLAFTILGITFLTLNTATGAPREQEVIVQRS